VTNKKCTLRHESRGRALCYVPVSYSELRWHVAVVEVLENLVAKRNSSHEQPYQQESEENW